MFVGGVALGDGEEGGEACFGGEVVVVVGEEGVRGVVVADAEDVELGIVELGEVGLGDKALHLGQQGVGVLAACCPVEGLQPAFDHIEAGNEVAAVGGADEEVGELAQ